MKKIKIKFVDFAKRKNTISVFGETHWKGGVEIITELLRKNYKVEISDNPDYVFCAANPGGPATGYDYYKYKDKILCEYLNESCRPDFTCFDYAIGGFHNITYGNRFFYAPASVLCSDVTRDAYNKALVKHLNVDDSMAKRKFCSFVVSNGNVKGKTAPVERETYYWMMNNYKTVESGGSFLNNVGGKVKDRVEFESKHKFSICFENAYQSVITEKIDMSFAAQTVPIYWGNTDIQEVYNRDAFIDCSDYDSFEDVLNEVIRLDNDDEAYLKMLKAPAFNNPKSEAYYMDKFEEFLVNIIETPYKKAINRTEVGWSGWIQNMRYDEMKRFYRKRKCREAAVKYSKAILGPAYDKVKDMKVLDGLKDYLMS